MVIELFLSIVIPLFIYVLGLLIGYFVFRNEQLNRHKSYESRFANLDKDIMNNDRRIRKEFNEYQERTESNLDKLENDLRQTQKELNQTTNRVSETSVIMRHFEETMKGVSDKVDIILENITKNSNN